MNRPALLRTYVACIGGLFAIAIAAETGLFTQENVLWPLAVLNFAFLAVALITVRGYVLTVSLACIAAAASIVAWWGVPPAEVAAALNKSGSIIAFVAVIPAVAVPIRLGGYVGAMEAFIAGQGTGSRSGGQVVRRLGSFVTLALIHLLMSIVLNIGAIPTMQRLLDRSRLSKKYLSSIYSAGYTSYMVLSPFDGLINALILAAGTTYSLYIGRGMLMAAAVMGAACMLRLLDRSPTGSVPDGGTGDPDPSAGTVPADATPRHPAGNPARKIVELAAHITVMIALSALAGRLVTLRNPAIATAFVILAWSAVWLRVLGVPIASLRGQGREYASLLSGYRSFLPFLVSAGFLGAMSVWTPLGDMLGAFITSMTVLPRYFTLQAIMLATALLSLVGVHMMITVVAIATALSPAALGLSAPGFALFLLSCWFVSMNVSPFVPFSTVVGEAIGEKTAVVALRYNSRMSLVMLVVAPLLMW